MEMIEIKRDYYLNKLIEKRNNGFIKVITGIRRCGKSYLLNTLFYNYLVSTGVKKDHIIRVAFDSAEDLELIGEDLISIEKEKRKVNPQKFIEYVRSKMTDDDMYFLLLDEVQLLDCFESVLNSYLRKNNVDTFVTGSNAKFLSNDIITEFAGRGDKIEMHPLSFSEFLSVYEGDAYSGLNEYMTYGGIPIVVLQKSIESKTDILENLFKEIYITDIVKRNKIRNRIELEKILDMISSAIGSLSNPLKIRNSFHSLSGSTIGINTVQKYLDCLEDAFLISSSQRFDIKGKAYISTVKKYYVEDMGLRNARMHFRQLEYTHIMENVIYNEIKALGYTVDIGVVNIRENSQEKKREYKQLEVDFVCNKGAARIYIQSAYSMPDDTKREQELRPLNKISDSFKKMVITGDHTPSYYDDNGILTVNVIDFLKDPQKYLN